MPRECARPGIIGHAGSDGVEGLGRLALWIDAVAPAGLNKACVQMRTGDSCAAIRAHAIGVAVKRRGTSYVESAAAARKAVACLWTMRAPHYRRQANFALLFIPWRVAAARGRHSLLLCRWMVASGLGIALPPKQTTSPAHRSAAEDPGPIIW